ncbi:MAG: hypothetical protein WCI49_13105 [Ferruginibacter sp.]
MNNASPAADQICFVTNFEDLVSIPFDGAINAICWSRTLTGDFAEIVTKAGLTENIDTLDETALAALELSEQGRLARDIIVNDLKLLAAHGADPTLNLILYYERDDTHPFFPVDVYSFHADRSPIPTATFLCTYYGEPSDILPNAQAQQKVLVPEIREQLKKQYHGPAEGFETFLMDHFFDLHYQATPGALPISLGIGNIWRLAIDHPESKVLPCVHRAPKEKPGEPRLLLIC